MKKINNTSLKNILLMLALAIVVLAVAGSALASRQDATEGIIAVQVLYKLDPRLSGGVHMGERWVSPANYDIISSRSSYTIEARVEGIESNGERVVIAADWVAKDPELVTITPTHDNMVALNIRRQGTTSVEVTAGGMTQTLYFAAAYTASVCTNLRVIVSRESQPALQAQACLLMLPVVNR